MSEPEKPRGHVEELPRVDVSERGGKNAEGEAQVSNRRLFMQLLVFECAENPEQKAAALAEKLAGNVGGVTYADTNNPNAIGLLTYGVDPSVFVSKVRPAIHAVGGLTPRPELTMLGRTYALGHEQDLDFWLVQRSQDVVQDESSTWHVWYPLRRTGAFAKLEGREQSAILREHAIIGRAYGAQNLAHDVRLACYGLDAHDNEFVIGLIGSELHPLSHVVQ